MKSLDFALLLSKYLTQYLPAQRDLSSNTICSYRDTFKLLLIFCRDIQGFNIAKLPMTQLDRKCIEDFILWLRNIRKSSPSTCNQRLAQSMHSLTMLWSKSHSLWNSAFRYTIFPEWFRPLLPQNTLHPMHYAVCWLSPTLQRQRDADTLFFLRFYTTRQHV